MDQLKFAAAFATTGNRLPDGNEKTNIIRPFLHKAGELSNKNSCVCPEEPEFDTALLEGYFLWSNIHSFYKMI